MARFFSLFALAGLLSVVSGQTSTSCNPLQKTCPDDPAMGSTLVTDFTKANSIPSGWSTVPGTVGSINYNSKGANIMLTKQGDNPTLESNGYFQFGSFEATVIAAPGQGIVTSMILLSDDLDEVDWELLGTNTAQVQSNYFSKGDASTFNRAAWHAVSNPQSTVHTYKIDWTPASVIWSIDGTVVRTLTAASVGSAFPQTPMRVRIGIWAGGDPSNGEGTIEWAGGATDYTKAPFTMYLQSVSVTNYNPGKAYTYTDTSGSWQKIAIDGKSVSGSASASSGTSTSVAASHSMTTSLSIASAAPKNPLTSMASGNATAAAHAPTDKPLSGSTGGNVTSTGSSAKQTASSAGQIQISAWGGMVAVCLAILQLGALLV